MEKHQIPLRATLKVCSSLQTSPLILPNLYRSTGRARNNNNYFRKYRLRFFVLLQKKKASLRTGEHETIPHAAPQLRIAALSSSCKAPGPVPGGREASWIKAARNLGYFAPGLGACDPALAAFCSLRLPPLSILFLS